MLPRWAAQVRWALTWISMHGCQGHSHSEDGVPSFEQPMSTLKSAQHSQLCAALVAEDERRGASRSELCVVLAHQRENCTADALTRCKAEMELTRTRDCPYDAEAEPMCEESAADVATCLLERLDLLELARPLTCESFEAPNDPAVCVRIQEACPYLLFPSYKFAKWDGE
jgi:hypothetical protein